MAVLKVPVSDYRNKRDKFPYMLLTTSNTDRSIYKNSKENNIYFTIDIFSNYKGEKEIYELVEKIDNQVSLLMALDNVMAIDQDTFLILDDKDPDIKHGVLIYKIKIVEVHK